MTMIGAIHQHSSSVAPVAGTRVRQALLIAGVFSSVLYVFTDIAGGLRYPGYSFTSQAISELMARGAPSETFVDPLFLACSLFAVGFGVGVFLQGRWNRSLRITGALLTVYALLGATGPTLFEMDQRGVGTLQGDAPHIILTAIIALLLMLAIGIGASSMGARFRTYSFVSLFIVAFFGALTGTFANQLAAGQPTPDMGIIERVCIYAATLWIAVLGTALIRRPGRSDIRSSLS